MHQSKIPMKLNGSARWWSPTEAVLTGIFIISFTIGASAQTGIVRQGIEEIRAQAEKDEPSAQFVLGLKYSFGDGVTKDAAESVKWFRKAAEQGIPIAQKCLGEAYRDGEGVSQDQVQAVKWFRKAADHGNAEAQADLGWAYENGAGVTKDAVEAVKWWRKAAGQGGTEGEAALGWAYAGGEGVAKDLVEAIKWTRKAAESGDDFGQFCLGLAFYNGVGVPRDSFEAVKWWRKAAGQGNTEAEGWLGCAYAGGEGVTKDEAEAARRWRNAAEKGVPDAQVSFGEALATGTGVTKDAVEAVKWWHKAADQGQPNAQYNLGLALYNGDGAAKDAVEAVKWWHKAADQGQPLAQYSLGVCYQNGDGVAKDYVAAYHWFNTAVANGDEDSKQPLAALETLMSREQIAKAQRLSGTFVPRLAAQPPKPVRSTDNEMRPSGTGSGFFISTDGYLITNEHVVRDAAYVRVATVQGTTEARVVKIDVLDDLAILKVEGQFSALPIAASTGVRLGDTVATVGFPNPSMQGASPKLAKGDIASLSGLRDDAQYFQISVPVQPGNSGGALVDVRGNVVGIVAAKLNARAALKISGQLPENVNYAVKSSLLLDFLHSLPGTSAKLKPVCEQERKFQDVVSDVEQAAVLVFVY
jgi:TPR repeat protein